MKTTIKEKSVKSEQPLKLENIKSGSIIEFDISNSPIGLVVKKISGDKEIVLLCHTFDNNDDNSWFQLAAGWKTQPIKKVLGRLTEIIVEPI